MSAFPLIEISWKSGLSEEEPDLAGTVAALVKHGLLDVGAPAYDVALAAAGRGYGRLTRAQRLLFDRDVRPAIEKMHGWGNRREGRSELSAESWVQITDAPANFSVQLGFQEGKTISALSFPCRLVNGRWVNATGRSIHVYPTHWRPWSRSG